MKNKDGLTAEYVIYSEILRMVSDWLDDDDETEVKIVGPFDSVVKIDACFDLLRENGLDDYISEAKTEIRCSAPYETDIECDWSRHYESKSVAEKFGDDWVGWTYWYGGGKFGDPGSIDWIGDAYFLKVTEEAKTVTVRKWKKVE